MRNIYLGIAVQCLVVTAAHAQDEFELAIVGDPQLSWNCNSGDIPREGTYCANEKNREKKGEVQAEEFNKLFFESVKTLKKDGGDKFKGLIINGDLTEFGEQKGNFERFKKIYTLNDKEYRKKLSFDIWPALGNHDYQNNIDDCGAKATPVRNKCAAVMMQYMGEWMIDAEKKGSIGDYDMPVFKKNTAQAQGQRNVTGSLAYSWDIGEFHFVQLQNYPTYTVDFKRGYSSGISSWTMKALSANHKAKAGDESWIEKDLKKAVSSGKRIILNWHQFTAYYKHGSESEYCIRDSGSKDKKRKVTFCQRDLDDLKTMLQPYASNIDAIFIGHHHMEIGKRDSYTLSLKGKDVPVYYSGSPVAGQYLKVTFNNSNKKFCLSTIQVGGAGTPDELVSDCRE